MDNSRKWIVIGGVAFLLFLIIFLLLSSLKPSGKTTTVKTASSEETEAVEKAASEEEWDSYLATDFSVDYPPNWGIKVYPGTSGGLSVIIKPLSLSEEDIYPSMTISSSPSSSQSAVFSDAFYIANNFKEKNMSVNGQEVSGWIGTIDSKTTPSFPVQERYTRLSSNGNDYTFSFLYKGDAQQQEAEQVFERILSSFQLL